MMVGLEMIRAELLGAPVAFEWHVLCPKADIRLPIGMARIESTVEKAVRMRAFFPGLVCQVHRHAGRDWGLPTTQRLRGVQGAIKKTPKKRISWVIQSARRIRSA